ncbi:chaperone DNAJ protein [Trypanosoma cruzi]|nr:chaperone DNAJ protein [Trypanosoma cruzi]
MQHTLSKEQLADFAQQAVISIRRFMSSSQEIMTLTQQDLISTSKSIEESWRKRRIVPDITVVELWAMSFQEELLSQLEVYSSNRDSNSNSQLTEKDGAPNVSLAGPSSGRKSATRKFIGESSLLACTEVLKILLRTNGEKSAEVFTRFHLATHVTKYLMRAPMSKKMRDAFASVLLEIAGYNSLLLEEFLSVSHELLVFPEGSGSGNVVTPQQVQLAWLLSSVFRRVDVNNVSADSARIQCGRDGFLSGIIRTCSLLSGGTAEGGNEGMRFTAFLVYFGLVNCMVRGCAANKALCRGELRDELVRLWVIAASNVSKVEFSLPIPTNVPGKDASLAVEGTQAWASELIEFLVEVATSDSFSLRRQALHDDSMNNGGGRNMLNNTGFPPLSPSPLSSPGISRASGGYEFLPAHWDTLLTGGSAYAWHLALLLFNCVLSREGCDFIAEALLRIDTLNAVSEFIYRGVIATLMLLCVATPRNAELLAESPIIEALIALITCSQASVFAHEVIILEKRCTPCRALNAYAIQTTMAFMSLLSSLCVAERTLPNLLHAVEEMCLKQTCVADADVIDSLLHVFTCSGLPRGVLFFSGCGSVVCMVDRFPTTRFNGYGFAAWIHPKCVWLEGCHLFSFTDGSSGTSVALIVVANGRSCSLMMRTRHSTDVTLSSIPDTSFPADAWSHVAFTHNMTGFLLFINGRKTENSLSISFPKTPTKKDRLQFAFGGYREEPSFFGFIASIELFDGSLSEKDVQRMYQAGPRSSREVPISCHPLLSVESQMVSGTTQLCVSVNGGLAGKNKGVSVHSVMACSPLNVQEMFLHEDVVNWALRTLVKAKNSSTNFLMIAKLCVQFVCTAMKLTTTEEELNRMVGEHVIGQLREDMLKWENIPIEVPAILIASTIPRGGGKVMRAHSTTQDILSLLLDVIHEQGVHPTVILCILRELSDALLLSENVAIFRAVPGRFERILSLSLELPPECVENVITLVERLFKESREMEQTLRFLLSASNSKMADFVKTEMLRMMFDITLTNTAMCDLIGGAFGNSGLSFLIGLVGGINHSSEAIRVFALRIISLMHHTNKRFREHFMKYHGYEMLGAVMTDTSSSVPIRLSTFNCLFQMAFDAFQPTENEKTTLLHLQQSSSSKTKRRTTRHSEHSHISMASVGKSGPLQGYMPGLLSPELRVTRREYSFDFSHDLQCVSDIRPLLDDTHRCPRSRANIHLVLQVPQAIQAVLFLLERLLRSVGVGTPPVLSVTGDSRLSSEVASDANVAVHEDRGANNAADSVSRVSVISPTQEDSKEIITLRVLGHIEKIVDRPENAKILLPFPWLIWLWGAVGPVLDPASNSSTEPLSKMPKKHMAAIQQQFRNIVRRLAILDVICNTKAGIVRTLRQTEQPPFLIRLVLEEIVAHFTKFRCEISSRSDATNIIKNLDFLFHGIEDLLRPFPLPLGLEIVNAISAIAVNNNSWVRTKMKNSSRLFETRRNLSLALLISTKRFSKLESPALTQLLGANGYEPNTIRVLLRRLISATSICDVDEVEQLLALTRQFLSGDPNHCQAILSIIGMEYRSFAELLCGNAGNRKVNSLACPERSLPGSTASSIRTEEQVTVDELPAAEVIRWSLEDKVRWETVRQRVYAATNSLGTVHGGGGSEDVTVSPLPRSKRIEERQQSIQHKVAAEVCRIKREVNYYLNMNGSSVASHLPNNSFMKTSTPVDSAMKEIQRNISF